MLNKWSHKIITSFQLEKLKNFCGEKVIVEEETDEHNYVKNTRDKNMFYSGSCGR